MYTFNAHFPKMVNERKCIKLKKLFYIGALSALLLTACGEEATPAKDVAPDEEPTEVKEEPVTAEVEEEEGLSEAQTATIEAFKSNDFMKFADAFYGLSAPERSDVYRSTVERASVTWTGVITDLETIKDSIVVMGKTVAYNGSDWTTLGNEHVDLVPYVIIVELNNPADKTGLNKGDSITFTGEIGARGDLEANFNWKLYKGEVTTINN